MLRALFYFLVAVPPSGDLFICAKDLFIEATASPSFCMEPLDQRVSTIRIATELRTAIVRNIIVWVGICARNSIISPS
jgi:hypothetical protein